VVRLGVQSDIELRQVYAEIMRQCRAPCPQCSGAGSPSPGKWSPGALRPSSTITDPLFGPVLLFGMGEFSPNSTRMWRYALADQPTRAREMLQEVKGARLLEASGDMSPPMWTRCPPVGACVTARGAV